MDNPKKVKLKEEIDKKMGFISKFIKKYTTGAPFVFSLISGTIIIAFFLFSEYIRHVDFWAIIYISISFIVWLIVGDIIKKKKIFNQNITFVIDSIFYFVTFGFIVYHTGGMGGYFTPILFWVAIISAVFGTVPQVIVFLIFLSAETYLICFFDKDGWTFNHLILVTFYVIFYFFLAGIVRYFYGEILKSEEKLKDLVDIAQKAETAAKLNEEKYSELIESTPLCIKVFDENMKMVFLNKGGREEHFIKDTDDISKWDWVGTVKKEYQAEAKEKFLNAFTKGESSTVEFEHTPEGSTHEWCSSLISPIKGKDGKVKSVLFLSSDITALKKAELEAKQNEQMFKTLLDATPMCIKWFDGKGNLISINKGSKEEHFLEKLSEEEIKKWNYWSCIEKDYHAVVKEKMGLALKGEESVFLMKHVPGTSKSTWCESTLVPVKNSKGEIIYVLFISRDVTQEKLIEEERKKNTERAEETKTALFNILEDVKESEINLKEEKDRSQAIISSMGEGLFVVDKDYKIILANKVTEKLFETSITGILGKDVRDVWKVFKGEEMVSDDERPIAKTLKTGEAIHVGLEDNFYYQNPVGKKIPVEIITTPLKGNGITGVVVVFQDISELKALDESQKSFISIASHQLRTPLTSIRWYAEMLDSEDAGPLNKDQKEFVGRVYGGALKLNEVINLLLSLARIESGKTEMEIKKVSLIPFTKDVIKELEPLLKQKALKTEIITKDKDLPEVDFDASMLRQIVTNLLSNSIRYTNDKGIIQVIIEKMPGSIVYSVKDDGIGIPENQRSKIFGKFFRAENAVSKVPDGSGLGLSLVKALVEMNKGTIWFETPASWVDETGKEVKKGTVFHFTIPLTSPRPSP